MSLERSGQKNRDQSAESDGRRESLLDFVRASGLSVAVFDDLAAFEASDAPWGMATAALHQGFAWLERGLDLVTETELFASIPGVRRRHKQEQASDVQALIKDLAELNVGDPVVHSAHGIGRYRGLVNMDIGQGPSEFLHLEYADKAALYVPVSQLHLIGRYTGVSADEAPLHRLGSGQWEKARRKAAEQVRDSAAELLNIYARRAAREGHAFRYSPNDYESFANDFGFEETADQKAAIHAVIQDMISPRPMDRLICGDVGFGKTEVALRAAFRPAWSSETMNFTPQRPRLMRLSRKSRQWISASEKATDTPSTRRLPSAVMPIATRTAQSITRPASRIRS